MYQILLTEFIGVLEAAYTAYKLHKRMATAKKLVQDLIDKIIPLDQSDQSEKFPSPVLAAYTGLLVFYDLEIHTLQSVASQSNFAVFMKDIGSKLEDSLIKSMSKLPDKYSITEFLQAWGPAMAIAYKDVADGGRYEKAISDYERGVNSIPSTYKLASLYGGLVAKNQTVLTHLKLKNKAKGADAPDAPLLLIDFVFNNKNLTDTIVSDPRSSNDFSKLMRSSSIYTFLTRNGHNPNITPTQLFAMTVRLTPLPFPKVEARYSNIRSSTNKSRAIYRPYDWSSRDRQHSKSSKEKVMEMEENDDADSSSTKIK